MNFKFRRGLEISRQDLCAEMIKDHNVLTAMHELFDACDNCAPTGQNYDTKDPELGHVHYALKHFDNQPDKMKGSISKFITTVLTSNGFKKVKASGRALDLKLRNRFNIAKVPYETRLPGFGGESYAGQAVPSSSWIKHNTQKAGSAAPVSALTPLAGKGGLETSVNPDALMFNQSINTPVSTQDKQSDLAMFKPTNEMMASTSVNDQHASIDQERMLRTPIDDSKAGNMREGLISTGPSNSEAKALLGHVGVSAQPFIDNHVMGPPADKKISQKAATGLSGPTGSLNMFLQDFKESAGKDIGSNVNTQMQLSIGSYQNSQRASGGQSTFGASPDQPKPKDFTQTSNIVGTNKQSTGFLPDDNNIVPQQTDTSKASPRGTALDFLLGKNSTVPIGDGTLVRANEAGIETTTVFIQEQPFTMPQRIGKVALGLIALLGVGVGGTAALSTGQIANPLIGPVVAATGAKLVIEGIQVIVEGLTGSQLAANEFRAAIGAPWQAIINIYNGKKFYEKIGEEAIKTIVKLAQDKKKGQSGPLMIAASSLLPDFKTSANLAMQAAGLMDAKGGAIMGKMDSTAPPSKLGDSKMVSNLYEQLKKVGITIAAEMNSSTISMLQGILAVIKETTRDPLYPNSGYRAAKTTDIVNNFVSKHGYQNIGETQFFNSFAARLAYRYSLDRDQTRHISAEDSKAMWDFQVANNGKNILASWTEARLNAEEEFLRHGTKLDSDFKVLSNRVNAYNKGAGGFFTRGRKKIQLEEINHHKMANRELIERYFQGLMSAAKEAGSIDSWQIRGELDRSRKDTLTLLENYENLHHMTAYQFNEWYRNTYAPKEESGGFFSFAVPFDKEYKAAATDDTSMGELAVAGTKDSGGKPNDNSYIISSLLQALSVASEILEVNSKTEPVTTESEAGSVDTGNTGNTEKIQARQKKILQDFANTNGVSRGASRRLFGIPEKASMGEDIPVAGAIDHGAIGMAQKVEVPLDIWDDQARWRHVASAYSNSEDRANLFAALATPELASGLSREGRVIDVHQSLAFGTRHARGMAHIDPVGYMRSGGNPRLAPTFFWSETAHQYVPYHGSSSERKAGVHKIVWDWNENGWVSSTEEFHSRHIVDSQLVRDIADNDVGYVTLIAALNTPRQRLDDGDHEGAPQFMETANADELQSFSNQIHALDAVPQGTPPEEQKIQPSPAHPGWEEKKSNIVRAEDLGGLDNKHIAHTAAPGTHTVYTQPANGMIPAMGPAGPMPIPTTEPEDKTTAGYFQWLWNEYGQPPLMDIPENIPIPAGQEVPKVIPTVIPTVPIGQGKKPKQKEGLPEPTEVAATETPTETPTATPTKTQKATPTQTPTETPTETPTDKQMPVGPGVTQPQAIPSKKPAIKPTQAIPTPRPKGPHYAEKDQEATDIEDKDRDINGRDTVTEGEENNRGVPISSRSVPIPKNYGELRPFLAEGGADDVWDMNDDVEAKLINRIVWNDFRNYKWDGNMELDNELQMMNMVEEDGRFSGMNDHEETYPHLQQQAEEEIEMANNHFPYMNVPQSIQDAGVMVMFDTVPEPHNPLDADSTDMLFHDVFLPPLIEIPENDPLKTFTPIMGTQLPDTARKGSMPIGGSDWPAFSMANEFIYNWRD